MLQYPSKYLLKLRCNIHNKSYFYSIAIANYNHHYSHANYKYLSTTTSSATSSINTNNANSSQSPSSTTTTTTTTSSNNQSSNNQQSQKTQPRLKPQPRRLFGVPVFYYPLFLLTPVIAYQLTIWTEAYYDNVKLSQSIVPNTDGKMLMFLEKELDKEKEQLTFLNHSQKILEESLEKSRTKVNQLRAAEKNNDINSDNKSNMQIYSDHVELLRIHDNVNEDFNDKREVLQKSIADKEKLIQQCKDAYFQQKKDNFEQQRKKRPNQNVKITGNEVNKPNQS